MLNRFTENEFTDTFVLLNTSIINPHNTGARPSVKFATTLKMAKKCVFPICGEITKIDPSANLPIPRKYAAVNATCPPTANDHATFIHKSFRNGGNEANSIHGTGCGEPFAGSSRIGASGMRFKNSKLTKPFKAL